MQKRYIDRREAAEYLTTIWGLPTSWRTLQKQATVGGGPEYQIYGNRAVYTPASLDRHAEQKLSAPRHSTSEMREVA